MIPQSINAAPLDVVFWTADQGGSRFYRCEEPARALRVLGYRTLVTSVMTPSWRRSPTIVGHRVVTGSQLDTWRHMIERRLPGQAFVYDADDDYFSLDPAVDPRTYEMYQRPEIRENIGTAASLADFVTVCSARLAEIFSRFNPRVEITPNTLPLDLATLPPDRKPAAPYVVGWAGSPGGREDLAMVAKAMKKIIARDRYAQVHIVGMPELLVRGLGLDHPAVRVTEWIQGTRAYVGAIDFDIWLAPHRDTSFNRSRFPTKIMEAAVRGIPLLASPVGEYRAAAGPGVVLVDDGNDAAETELQWWSALRAVAELRRWRALRDLAAGRGHQHLTECHAARWRDLYIR